MIKLRDDAICKPLEMIFNQALSLACFYLTGKRPTLILFIKKVTKNRSVSLLPVCCKIFERLISNKMVRFFLDNKLSTTNQSGFKPGDSCINQLLSITYEIYKSFDDELEIRSVFLDISKPFDKVLDKVAFLVTYQTF